VGLVRNSDDVVIYKGNGFLAVRPNGEYDTNLGPDSAQFRWIVSDEPFQSLAPQRSCASISTPRPDRESPGVYGRAELCSKIQARCWHAESLTSKDRDVQAWSRGQRQTRQSSMFLWTENTSSDGRFRSGIYNPRLFRNNRFVAHDPDQPCAVFETFEDWRKLNAATTTGDPAQGRWPFTVPRPYRRRHRKAGVFSLCLQFGQGEERHGAVYLYPPRYRAAASTRLHRDDWNRSL